MERFDEKIDICKRHHLLIFETMYILNELNLY